MKANKFFFWFAAPILLILDQATKHLAYTSSFGGFLNYLKPVFRKLLFPNYNFAFSINLPHALVYILYAALLILLTSWFLKQEKKDPTLLAGYSLIVIGALSNILDRVVLGYVRDFIYVFWGNIFNLADLYIVIGILLLIFRKQS